ncbi:glycosyltransferase [Microbacterium sp.]|uniref:glycosyltransferase n=1 Tax=Microbacterium sp. TaxID=51671 RepID=UPI00356544A4
MLHFNSFFTPHLTILPLLLLRVGFWGRPVTLLAPRGEFGDGALSRRAWKKRLYIRVFRILRLHRSVIWHSTATHETDAIRAMWGSNAQIVYRENDTLLPPTALPPVHNDSGALRAIYLSRIVEHKGLHIVLEALRDSRSTLVFDIYGSPEDEEYAQRCEAVARSLPSNITVTFHGTIKPEGVRDVLANHDVLLMPTAGENFGHVVAEALSVSCAVVTTPKTPWTGVLQGGAGFVVDRNVEDWRVAIESLARLDPACLIQLRQAAGDSYTLWASRPRAPHVWQLALELLTPRLTGSETV